MNDLNWIIWTSFFVFLFILIKNFNNYGLTSPVFIYLLLIFLFHLSTVISVYIFKQPIPLREYDFLFDDQLAYMIVLVMYGVLSFQIGVELSTHQKRIRYISHHPVQNKIIFKYAVLLLFVFAIAYIILGLQSRILIEGKALMIKNRMEKGGQGLFGIIFQLLTITSIIAVAFAPKKKYMFYIALFVLMLYLPLFISGKRGSFFILIFSFIVIFDKKGIKIPVPIFFISSILALYLIHIIAITKKDRDIGFSEQWYLDSVYEMGQQLQMPMWTLNAIQDGITDFWHGTSYLWGLWRVIPNISGLRHLFEPADPGLWATEMITGSQEVGLDFSVIAEAYLNFGVPGIFIVLGLIGYLLGRFEQFELQSPKLLAIYGATLTELFFAVRGDMSAVFRAMIWTALIIWFLKKISASRIKNENMAVQ